MARGTCRALRLEHNKCSSIHSFLLLRSNCTNPRSIWSNFVIYDLPSINIGMDSGSVQRSSAVSFTIENDQRSYHSNQDTTPVRDHLATISMDGSSITAKGNMWRAFPLNPPKTAEELGDFVVSFDYLLTDPGDFHVLCFEDNLKWGDHDDPIDNEYDPLRCVEMNQIEGLRET